MRAAYTNAGPFLHLDASVSRLLSGSVVAVRESSSSWSALDAVAELAAEAAFKVHEAAEAEESFGVVLAVEGAEHAGEVIGGGDLRAEAVAERLAIGATAKVVV